MHQRRGPPGSDPRANLRLLRSHGMAVLDDVLYIDSGKSYKGSTNASNTLSPENDEDWLPNRNLFSIDLQNSLSSLKFESIKPRISAHDKGNKPNISSGAIVADYTSSFYIFHLGGLLEPKVAPGHFWTYTPSINDYHSYFRAPNSTLKRYDGAAVASQYRNMVYYQGGIGPQGMTSRELNAVNMDNGEGEVAAKGDPVSGSVLSWLPFGEEGVLVSIGGVDADGIARSMDSVGVFDIKSAKWFTQTVTKGTDGLPYPRRKFCAITPRYYPSKEASEGTARNSFGIIIRGGIATDTSNSGKTAAFDDIWALPLPSFTWVRYFEGTKIISGTGNVASEPYVRNQTCALIHDTYLTWLGTAPRGQFEDSDVMGFFDIADPLSYKATSSSSQNANRRQSKRAESELPYDSGKTTYSVPATTRDVVASKSSPAAGWTEGLEEIFSMRIEEPPGSSSYSLGAGAKIGIAVGVVVLIILMLAAAWWLLKVFHKRKRDRKRITMLMLPPKPQLYNSGEDCQELGGQAVSELQSAETLESISSWRQQPIELPAAPSSTYPLKYS